MGEKKSEYKIAGYLNYDFYYLYPIELNKQINGSLKLQLNLSNKFHKNKYYFDKFL